MLNDRELITEFVVESKEHLAGVENQLLAIEAAGIQADADLVNQVFRTVHSIKGAAGFLGLTAVGRLSHEMENVLNLVRNRELTPEPGMTNVLLRAADELRGLLDDVEHSNDRDLTRHLEALEALVAGAMADGPAPTGEAASIGAPASSREPSGGDPAGAPFAEPLAPAWPAAEAEAASTPPVGPAPRAEPATPAGPEAHHEAAAMAAPAVTAGGHADTNIRVAVTVLDRLMNLAGELVLSRNQLLQTVNAQDSRNLASIAARLDQVTSELQETIMQARMQEVGTVFSKFPRVVRDLSAALGKQCELRLEGTDVELDKSIIEAIGDPLTHLVRNSIDHGIEPPEVRAQRGKSPRGTIVLKAFHQAGKVNISISDNGRGMDAAKIREKAVAKGILSPDQAREMNDREALRLILRPGFSTAETVTDVSGRGVGMDVVRTNIERLGGTVSIETEPGAGTTIQIKLPLTLAILPSLIVGCRGQRFAIPQASISELVRVKPEEFRSRIQRIKGAEVIRLRGELLPLVRLQRALGLESGRPADAETQATRATHVIVVETGQFRYGLAVDGLHDSEEIVVKPLGRHMQDCPCLAGATILGDGRVAMILDVTGIAGHTGLAVPDENDLARSSAAEARHQAETQTALLFSNHPAEWFAVPMDLISRVERIRSEQIEDVGGQMVLTYRGGTLPLVSLDAHLRARPRAEKTRLYVAIYGMLKREVGLVVPELVDIRQLMLNVDTATFREPGVAGSLVVDGHTTRLLDLYELTEAARPDWFRDRPQPAATSDRPPAVLLAEDSDFFRKQLTGYLEAEHYEVVACADGQDAWDTLRADPGRFRLVVTDIEMPRMTGLQLAEQIRGNAATAGLPVIALSSLAGDDDIERGRAAGVDEYLVKIDRDQLVATTARYLQGAPVGAAR